MKFRALSSGSQFSWWSLQSRWRCLWLPLFSPLKKMTCKPGIQNLWTLYPRNLYDFSGSW